MIATSSRSRASSPASADLPAPRVPSIATTTAGPSRSAASIAAETSSAGPVSSKKCVTKALLAQRLREHVAVGVEHLADERVDLIECERRRGVRVEHGGVEDVVAAALENGAHREVADVRERAVECGALGRDLADMRRVDTGEVDEAGHLDAHVRGEVRDQVRVAHVAVDHARLARLDRV